MSRLIMFSRVFPKGNVKEGKPTFFPEGIWTFLLGKGMPDVYDFAGNYMRECDVKDIDLDTSKLKLHTIRKGNRWKVGDWFSPRVWSGKPYRSKTVALYHDMQVKQVFEIEIKDSRITIEGQYFGSYVDGAFTDNIEKLAENDCLSLYEFVHWFGNKHFKGQIICWSENVKYV